MYSIILLIGGDVVPPMSKTWALAQSPEQYKIGCQSLLNQVHHNHQKYYCYRWIRSGQLFGPVQDFVWNRQSLQHLRESPPLDLARMLINLADHTPYERTNSPYEPHG